MGATSITASQGNYAGITLNFNYGVQVDASTGEPSAVHLVTAARKGSENLTASDYQNAMSVSILSDSSALDYGETREFTLRATFGDSSIGGLTATASRASASYPPSGGIYITDNYNNSFKIAVRFDDSTTTCTSAKWYYEDLGEDYSTVLDSSLFPEETININTSIPDPSASTRRVCVKATLKNNYSSTTIDGHVDIKQYVSPTMNGTPQITYNKDKITIKEPWTFTWGATEVNKSSPVVGYNFWLVVTNRGGQVELKDVVGENITGGTKQFTTTGTSITFNPALNGMVVGDICKFFVQPFTCYGENNDGAQLVGGPSVLDFTVENDSDKNSSMINIFVDGEWQEGEVYTKVGTEWKPAEAVYAKVNGEWTEV